MPWPEITRLEPDTTLTMRPGLLALEREPKTVDEETSDTCIKHGASHQLLKLIEDGARQTLLATQHQGAKKTTST